MDNTEKYNNLDNYAVTKVFLMLEDINFKTDVTARLEMKKEIINIMNLSFSEFTEISIIQTLEKMGMDPCLLSANGLYTLALRGHEDFNESDNMIYLQFGIKREDWKSTSSEAIKHTINKLSEMVNYYL